MSLPTPNSNDPPPETGAAGPPEIVFLSPVQEHPAAPVQPYVIDQATIPPEPPPLPQPGFWMAVGLLILFVVVQVIFAVAGILLMGGDFRKIETSQVLILNTMAILLTSLALALMFLREQTVRTLAVRGLHPGQLLVAVAMVLPLAVINIAGVGWLAELMGDLLAEAQEVAVPAGDPATNLLDQMNAMYAEMAEASWPVMIIFFCLFPAVGEEVFFRGLLGRGLVARFRFWGLVLTSLFFGISHLDPVRVLATLILGMAIHAIYLATCSLTAPIVVHFLNNLLIFGSYKLLDDEGHEPIGLARFDTTPPDPALVMVAALALAALGWILYQLRTRWRLPDGTFWQPGFATPEMPPAGLAARPICGRPSVASMLFAVGATAIFGWLYVTG